MNRLREQGDCVLGVLMVALTAVLGYATMAFIFTDVARATGLN